MWNSTISKNFVSFYDPPNFQIEVLGRAEMERLLSDFNGDCGSEAVRLVQELIAEVEDTSS
jgi:hypothetical protein